MLIEILKIEDNIKFVDQRDYMITSYDTEGTKVETRNIKTFCDRAWLRDDFPFEIIENNRFEFRNSYGKIFDWIIDEKGKDENGWYILIINPKDPSYFRKKDIRCIIGSGEYDVQLVFSPDMIKGYEKILSDSEGIWPSFHDSEMEIIERCNSNLWLRFRDGYLCDRVIDLKMYGIVREDYGENVLEDFKDWITGVSIKKRDELMEVLLCNDYTTSKLKEGIVLEEITEDILRDEYDAYFIDEEFVNHGYIFCKTVSIDVHTCFEEKSK